MSTAKEEFKNIVQMVVEQRARSYVSTHTTKYSPKLVTYKSQHIYLNRQWDRIDIDEIQDQFLFILLQSKDKGIESHL